MKSIHWSALASLAAALALTACAPAPRYTVASDYHDTPCRQFVVNADVGGRPDKVVGTACPQPDGSWKIVP